MPIAEPCPVSLRRLRAVAILKFGTVDALHKRLPLCARAIWAQIQRGRLSPAVHAALLAALGEDAWRFITGQTDTLADEGGAHV